MAHDWMVSPLATAVSGERCVWDSEIHTSIKSIQETGAIRDSS